MTGETEAALETEATEQAPSEEQATANAEAPTSPNSLSIEERLLDPTLSKTQRKKLMRKQMQQEARKEKKKDIKAARRDEVARRREEAAKEFDALPEELKAERIAQRKTSIEARKAADAAKKQRQQEAFEKGQNLVLDLEFNDLMLEKERKSLMSQLMYCYAANNRAPAPCRLVLTGLMGAMGAHYHSIPGSQQWKVDAQESRYIEYFAESKEKLVYLTADSTNEITDLDPDKVYIIGGIVDHNRYKNLTLNKANKQGIAHARLPIGNDLKMITSKVLTVNQVVEIVLNYLDSKDWKAALVKAIPKRKRDADEEDGEDEDEPEAKTAKEGEPEEK
mmetsp:Transcript_20448/g.44752  ORF Transcript_20448/g.44752 Transcript_20448/m.44752 type:complete len:335 (-) Transcript_20448:510-1514(-)